MFDLKKDIEKYQGVTPYASEHYGVYQPILGWESKLTKKWIQRGGTLIDPQIKRILDGRLLPGPTAVTPFATRLGHIAGPLEPASAKSPFKVLLTKNLNSELLKLVQTLVQSFVDNPENDGRLPENDEWNQIIKSYKTDEGPMRFHGAEGEGMEGLLLMVNIIHELRLSEDQTANDETALQTKLLELMQYESQIAAFLLFHAESRPGFDPNELNKLFSVQIAPPLSDILKPTDALNYIDDPLATIDPRNKNGALSPVGFVHRFRQYFFDLGTFLGEPVEHIWLAPGTTIELIEVSTRKTITELTQESFEEAATHSEQSTSVKDELSDAIKSENASSTKLGISTTHSVNYKVYEGTATASINTESTRKEARETSHKQNREQAEKVSSDIKRNFKSIFRTVTETTDTRSRRYVLQNTGNDLVNYELRRKMRRVGVQLQDLGQQLCWQVFVDKPGFKLGLSELVHFAESPDLSNLKQPEIGPPPGPIKKVIPVLIPFHPPTGHGNDDFGPGANYGDTTAEVNNGFYEGHRVNTHDEDAEDARVVMGPFNFKLDPPQMYYELVEVRLIGPKANQQAIVRSVEIKDKAKGSFDLVMDLLNFGGQPVINFEVEMIFAPSGNPSGSGQGSAYIEYETNKKTAQAKYDAEVSRLRKKSFMEDVRKRIKDASFIKSRPSWDLREEERTIIFRELIEKLMLDSWEIANKNPKDGGANSRLSHVRSEIIRAIFDVDAMLYYVAPEWWMPHKRSQFKLDIDAKDPKINLTLTDDDLVKWDDSEVRKDNYKITEESAPAKLGSSLGWLLQLDGDNLRNAFLNAPWVKAVLPVRPGREKAALTWLRSIEGHEHDGWDTDYIGNTPEDRAIITELVASEKKPSIGNVLEKVAEQLEKQNGDIKNVLEADKVFEKGFSHLGENSFDAGLPENQIFSQWITVLPTDQIVAVEYKSTELFKP